MFDGCEPYGVKDRKDSQDFQAQGVARSDLQRPKVLLLKRAEIHMLYLFQRQIRRI